MKVNNYVSQVFKDEANFVEVSKHLVTHLYEQSNSAQIKIGDVIVVLFEGLEYRDASTRALGIFKIENKAEFFSNLLRRK